MSEKTYYGWSNYETWNCALWLDNEQGTYTYWNDRAQEGYDDTDNESEAVTQLAEEIKQNITDETPEVHGMYSDILSAALSEIDWYEIAEHYLSDVDKKGPAND